VKEVGGRKAESIGQGASGKEKQKLGNGEGGRLALRGLRLEVGGKKDRRLEGKTMD
jgi:hypothetical protein